jgi:serine/threonine protein kinase
MTLATGARIGPYEIVTPLGSGGMGEVYKARDTRLRRTVAIKIIRTHLSGDAEFRSRFQREAHAIAALQHPHVCTLYDVGHENGTDFLIMEYVEGETLADRLSKGAVPLAQALKIAIEIADALDKAHRQGIVHRDLKPGNIMITKSGAKLLDFGLAKLRPTNHQEMGAVSSSLATAPAPLTERGTIIGTLQYMAPEQLEAKESDARTDIFAFGAVLYEMISGHRAFEGNSPASVIGAILRSEPTPLSTFDPISPPILDHLVARCLAKDPDERWQTASDVMRELKWIAAAREFTQVVATPLRSHRRERLVWIATVGALLTSLTATLLVSYKSRGHPETRVVRFTVPPPEKSTFAASQTASISPDGRRLAFVASSSDGPALIWVRWLDALSAQPLPGTENPSYPFWSPDSRNIGFFASGALKRIDASGGPTQTLAETPIGMGLSGGSWSSDGTILFGLPGPGPLYRVAATGGATAAVTTLDRARGETGHWWPHFLPDGRHFLYFTRALSPRNRGLALGSLDSPAVERLVSCESVGAYAAPGFMLFAREGVLLAQSFNTDTLQLEGEATPVAERVQQDNYFGMVGFSVSQNGVLVYKSGRPEQEATELVWLDRGGHRLGVIRLTDTPADYEFPFLSRDDRRVSFEVADPQTARHDVWVLDLSTNFASRFTFDPASSHMPVWSPDGRRIAFASGRQGPWDLYEKMSNGGGQDELLLKSADQKYVTDWSRDGRFILYHAGTGETKRDVWVLPLFGDRQPFPFLRTKADEAQAQFSPDGHWIAYASDETGRMEVYIQAFPSSGGKWPVSRGGGIQPLWRGDGRELFFIGADQQLMAVGIHLAATPEVGLPKQLFHTHIPVVQSGVAQRPEYSVTRDGQRFLVNRPLLDAEPLNVVLNWPAALKH